jgi:hypothetical protein
MVASSWEWRCFQDRSGALKASEAGHGVATGSGDGKSSAVYAAAPEHPQSIQQKLLYIRKKMHHIFHS